MKKILFVWLLCTGCDINTVSDPNTSAIIIKDSLGNKHSYAFLRVNHNNWCVVHQKYEFVERRIYYQNFNMHSYTPKNQKNSEMR